MISNRKLALALSLAGWALTYVVAKSRKDAVRTEHKLHKKQMTTWEGEGGNLPPRDSTASQPGLQ
ncbi:hypothetical protein [Actimicrobium antarcticum]|uniref:Secreted protein n=1 Tax=Actimicrobium antarcticum TaxID=1051899 RepID=A0ABP7T6N1_9BURK